MRETRLSGSEGGGAETNRLFLPLSPPCGGSPMNRAEEPLNLVYNLLL
jgi:hypothetical protein